MESIAASWPVVSPPGGSTQVCPSRSLILDNRWQERPGSMPQARDANWPHRRRRQEPSRAPEAPFFGVVLTVLFGVSVLCSRPGFWTGEFDGQTDGLRCARLRDWSPWTDSIPPRASVLPWRVATTSTFVAMKGTLLASSPSWRKAVRPLSLRLVPLRPGQSTPRGKPRASSDRWDQHVADRVTAHHPGRNGPDGPHCRTADHREVRELAARTVYRR